jgi:hypothetical protein
MNLKEINLGEEGLAYLASYLKRETGLCAKIAVLLERGGDVFAPLPVGTTRQRALQYKAGGLLSWRETSVWCERELKQLSHLTDNGSLVFQDVWAKQQDPVWGEHDGLFFDRSSVYYVVGPHDFNAAAISLAVRQIISFRFVAVFTNFNFRAADIPPTRVVDETFMDEIAHGAKEIFLSAYDQEGLVVWRRD